MGMRYLFFKSRYDEHLDCKLYLVSWNSEIYEDKVLSKEVKNVAIQQINIGYNAPEDRLLLKIGMSDDTELNVWLTRKVVKALWQLLQEANLVVAVAPDVDSPQAQELLQSFAKESAAQQLDFSEEYKKRSSANSEELLLAHECQVAKIGNNIPTLEFVCTNGQTVKVVLNQELSLALSSMLQMAAREAAWDLAFSEQSSLLSPVTANTVLH
jgi:hypothetical protein